ncbi:DUF3365 domain-containing protein [Psychroserpens burtonensis]|uniref:DUF3365 domain-containing protein n=1 Tax=Psychroserpens burtonensis TaxID=49278 RepID=A0A5C7BCP7_9FLAO|nr:DUF3365 domain-containing protein [Psychroserpens burtonensis]TXE16745.1 DUF3365 domain-containing protein [Psychroserpens burtonensis]
MKNLIVLMLLLLFVFGCNKTKDKSYVSTTEIEKVESHPGKKLMQINCYVCHSPTASHDDRIGPPMVAVKKHYLEDGMTKEQFTNDIQNWINNPTKDTAKMHGAVKRFGVMPKQVFPEETIKQISDYMFDYDIEEPTWFEDHFNSKKVKQKGQGLGKKKGNHKQQEQANAEDLTDGKRGLNYALTTKAVLGRNLMGILQKKGTIEALTFCNTKAYPLTDSMATVHNATIKRVTDKPRNPDNIANSEELIYIEKFKERVFNEDEIDPIVIQLNDKVQFYYPIITNSMCLQCHGKPNETIKKDVLNTIAQFYPKDKAIGYEINEVRGLWSVSFEK